MTSPCLMESRLRGNRLEGNGGIVFESVVREDTAGKGRARVFRGGSWGDLAWGCRAAYRLGSDPGARNDYLGFRLVLAHRSAASLEPAR